MFQERNQLFHWGIEDCKFCLQLQSKDIPNHSYENMNKNNLKCTFINITNSCIIFYLMSLKFEIATLFVNTLCMLSHIFECPRWIDKLGRQIINSFSSWYSSNMCLVSRTRVYPMHELPPFSLYILPKTRLKLKLFLKSRISLLCLCTLLLLLHNHTEEQELCMPHEYLQ